MMILLIVLASVLLVILSGSSEQHYQEWRKAQLPEVQHAVYPDNPTSGGVLGTLIFAGVLLAMIALATGAL